MTILTALDYAAVLVFACPGRLSPRARNST
jgi:hypothetical protein